jgi:broad specificity phosphatase PhoE
MFKKLLLPVIMSLSFFINASDYSLLENPFAALRLITQESEFNEIPAIRTDAYDYLGNTTQHEGKTRIIFVRHGESNSNAEKSIAGRTLDSDLSSFGLLQAQAVGNRFLELDLHFDEVYSSPMTRAMKTARLAYPSHEKALNIDERLHEKWYGPFEGANADIYHAVVKKEEIEIPQLKTFAEKFSYKADPGMESSYEVYARVCEFIDDVESKHHGKNILVGSHGGLMKALFMADAALNGYLIEYRSFDLENCGIIVSEIDYCGAMQVVATRGVKFLKKK